MILVERLNQRVDTRDELASLVSVPIIVEIGRVPARRRPGHGDGRIKLDGIWSEHYRRVRSAIQFVQADAAAQEDARRAGPTSNGAVIAGHRAQSGAIPRAFLFASALPGEGKSTSTALTAMALAETGDDTLVINADFRRPMVEKYLGASSSPSLADRAELDVNRIGINDVVQTTDEPHLFVASRRSSDERGRRTSGGGQGAGGRSSCPGRHRCSSIRVHCGCRTSRSICWQRSTRSSWSFAPVAPP